MFARMQMDAAVETAPVATQSQPAVAKPRGQLLVGLGLLAGGQRGAVIRSERGV